MIDKHLLKLRARDELTDEEEQAIRDSIDRIDQLAAGEIAIEQGQECRRSTMLLDGLMCRYKDLRDGRRQITELQVAGDFVDLHGFSLKRLDHGIMALTPCRVAYVAHERLTEITERYPHLTRLYWFHTNIDAAIHREWELSLGRRSAAERLAQLFCEMRVRLGVVGLADDAGYELNLTQSVLAECLGLTPIHVNRTLKELRERGAVTFRAGRVTIHDWARLSEIAEFDAGYLYLERRSR
jgi:CRP-like cAMP-binding protein